MEKFIGVLGQPSLRKLFDNRFLIPKGGVYEIGPDTVDIGIHPEIGWIADEPFSFPDDGGFINPEFWGKPINPSEVILRPGQTLVAPAAISLDLVDVYAFASPRSRMARVGVATTANVVGFSEKNWAKRDGPVRADIYASVTTRKLSVKNITKLPLFSMRMFTGDTRLNREEVMKIILSGHDLLIDPRTGKPLPKSEQVNAIGDSGEIITRVHLQDGMVGFKLKKSAPTLDLSENASRLDWRKYFDPVFAKRDSAGRLFVDLYADEYYLLVTWNGLNLPQGYVASLEQLDSKLINAVVHFAEYFGHAFKGGATLEVVPVEHSIRLYDKSPIGAFRLEVVELGTPRYQGFSLHQNVVPNLPPMFRMPTLEEVKLITQK